MILMGLKIASAGCALPHSDKPLPHSALVLDLVPRSYLAGPVVSLNKGDFDSHPLEEGRGDRPERADQLKILARPGGGGAARAT